MQDTTKSQEGINVFIDFQIIQNSQPDSLSKELDVLIKAGKKIHLWSKSVSQEDMRKHCLKITIPVPKEEQKLHKEVWNLRHVERKTFGDIANLLKIPISKVSYFSKAQLRNSWSLDDFIASYEKKDSSIYPKVDFLVDLDPKLVDRFKRAGRPANLVTKV